MAWNEPGKGQNPWGGNNKGNGSGGGPPDLDEIWNRLRKRFSGGGGGNGGASSGGGGGIGAAGIGLIAVVVAVIWLLSGFYVVDAGERGVVLQFGSYKSSSGPGPHWHLPYPIQTVEKVDIQKVRSARDSAVMLTKDENIVDVKVTAQYRVNDAGAYLFNIRAPDETVQETLKSAVREVVGTSRMNEVIQRGAEEVALEQEILGSQIINEGGATPDSNNEIAADDEGDTVTQPESAETDASTQSDPTANDDEEVVEQIREEQSAYPVIEKRSRADLPLNITKILQYNLDSYNSGLTVTAVNVQYAQPPEAVQSAFEAAIKAREEQQRLKNEARAYAQDVINTAQGEADALVNQAEGYRARVVQRSEGDASRFTQLLIEYERAPDVTRKRLYLDTMQSVLQDSTKVLIDSKQGNQLMYLPLDKIIQQSGRRSSDDEDQRSSSSRDSGSSSNNSPTPIDPLRSRSR